jgi:hypothetical protein
MPILDMITDEYQSAIDAALEKYGEKETIWRQVIPAVVTIQGSFGQQHEGTGARVGIGVKSHSEIGQRLFKWMLFPIDATAAELDGLIKVAMAEIRAQRRAKTVFENGGSGVS